LIAQALLLGKCVRYAKEPAVTVLRDFPKIQVAEDRQEGASWITANRRSSLRTDDTAENRESDQSCVDSSGTEPAAAPAAKTVLASVALEEKQARPNKR
jgi:hypothetical protein